MVLKGHMYLLAIFGGPQKIANKHILMYLLASPGFCLYGMDSGEPIMTAKINHIGSQIKYDLSNMVWIWHDKINGKGNSWAYNGEKEIQ